jgi:hypothetical protein
MVVSVAFQGAWMSIPDEWKATLPKQFIHIATIILLVMGITGRLIKQNPPERNDDEQHSKINAG